MKLSKNCMGTTDIRTKFKGMRKEQSFIVYPITDPESIKIQSDTRIGRINLNTGEVSLCPPVSSGAYNHHLMLAKVVDTLTDEKLNELKSFIRSTASSKAGTNGICYTDNSLAAQVQS